MVTAKMAGGILVIIAASIMGILYGEELQKRLDNLYEIQKILILLKGEMKYHQAPIGEVFRGMEHHVKGEFAQLFVEAAVRVESSFGKTLQEIWQECCKLYLHRISLWKVDRQEFQRLGEILGYLDTATQGAGFELYGHKLQMRIEQCSGELAGKQRLSRCLGVAGGIFIVVLLI